MGEITSKVSEIGWKFDNTYVRLPDVMLSKTSPVPVKSPKLVLLNKKLSKDLNLDFSNISNEDLGSIFSGNFLPKGSESIAQAYAGHQFGHFTILGDGRAIIIGEHVTKNNERVDIQFKGSGLTPYSRQADGRAALGPMLREYLISEAMHGLKIPTSRSLAVVKTGEDVIRETPLPGAILTRVASSHIRVGTFQYAAMKGDLKTLKTLIDYSIKRHYFHLKDKQNQAIALLNGVIEKQIKLVIEWMRVGFIHGVMNTDNMTISGETIDYGPCAFMDTYNPETVFSSIDYNGRYAFFNQPAITKWNLVRLAESLLPLINENEKKAIQIAEETINTFDNIYKNRWLEMMRNKLGIFGEETEDENLINSLLDWMLYKKSDYTNTFCYLMEKDATNSNLFNDEKFIDWKKKWNNRIKKNNKNFNSSLELMKNSNPLIIPRNHNVEKALNEASNDNNLSFFNNLVKVLSSPYEVSENLLEYQSLPKIINKDYKTFCGT